MLSGPSFGAAVRPRVTINAAMSLDGKIALPDGHPVRLSNGEDLARVHRLRAAVDAVLVGIGTVLMDDPKLTVKREYAEGKNPIRIVVDSDGRTPDGAAVLDGSAPTIVATTERCDRVFPRADVVRYGKDEVDLTRLLEDLSRRGVSTLLVEGGSTIAWSFLREGLVDELKVFVRSSIIGGRSTPTLAGGRGATLEKEIVPLRLVGAERLGDGVLLEYAAVR